MDITFKKYVNGKKKTFTLFETKETININYIQTYKVGTLHCLEDNIKVHGVIYDFVGDCLCFFGAFQLTTTRGFRGTELYEITIGINNHVFGIDLKTNTWWKNLGYVSYKQLSIVYKRDGVDLLNRSSNYSCKAKTENEYQYLYSSLELFNMI